MTKKIKESAPAKYTLRDCQIEALDQVEAAWSKHKVIIINSPVASGKSLQAIAIARWAQAQGQRTALITPQVILQEQYTAEFTDIPSLKGRARYCCSLDEYSSCDDRFAATDKTCTACPYTEARRAVQNSPIGVYNLYSYLFSGILNKNKKTEDPTPDILIVDEAHSIMGQLAEVYAIKLWKHEDKYPDELATQGDAVMWMEEQIPKLEEKRENATKPGDKSKYGSKINKMKALISGISRSPGHFFYEKKMELYRGSKRECIEIRPITLKYVAHTFWAKPKKIVLMSATLRKEDLEYLGLDERHCKYIEVESPIPKENRPIIVRPTAQMSHQNLKVAVPRVCAEINKLILEHSGKGIIHTTYGLVPLMKKYLTDDRFVWHTQATRLAAYDKFRKADDNKILIACGMSEGIDLIGADYEWQVITKIMFPSLLDGLVKRQKEAEPSWYAWQTIKTTIQQTGRICRSPTDYGVTYILDANFNFLYYGNKQLFPNYIKESLEWLPRKSVS